MLQIRVLALESRNTHKMSAGFRVICLTLSQNFNRTTSVQASALAWILSPPSTSFLEYGLKLTFVAAHLHAYKVQDTDSSWSEDGREALVFECQELKKRICQILRRSHCTTKPYPQPCTPRDKYKWLLISRKKLVKFILYYTMYKGISHHKRKCVLQNC